VMPEVKRVHVCGRMVEQGPIVIALRDTFQQEDLEVSFDWAPGSACREGERERDVVIWAIQTVVKAWERKSIQTEVHHTGILVDGISECIDDGFPRAATYSCPVADLQK
jgi:hypothetical protein